MASSCESTQIDWGILNCDRWQGCSVGYIFLGTVKRPSHATEAGQVIRDFFCLIECPPLYRQGTPV